jgi:Domain of unknown function (DUF1127)
MRLLCLSIGRLLRKVMLYIGASPLSRRHQLETLRGLDDHLLRDIGVSRPIAAHGRPDPGMSSTGV